MSVYSGLVYALMGVREGYIHKRELLDKILSSEPKKGEYPELPQNYFAILGSAFYTAFHNLRVMRAGLKSTKELFDLQVAYARRQRQK